MSQPDLSSDTTGLNSEQLDKLEKSVGNLIETNKKENDRAIAATIQRRGQNLPGDTGDNFGLESSLLHGPGSFGPYDMTYPGSRYFSGLFGGSFGLNHNGSFLHQHGIQGSNVLLSRTTRLAHQKMGLCVSAYKGYGVAKNVIDLMANFAAEGLRIKHPNKTIERFYQRWMNHVDLQGRVKDILRYYYKYGNVFIYTTPGIIDKHVYDRMRRSRAAVNPDGSIPNFIKADSNDPENDERIGRNEKELQKDEDEREIPWRYTLLNPFQMELRGSKFFGESRWVFVLDQHTINESSRGRIKERSAVYDFVDDSEINLPPEFKRLSTQRGGETPDGELNDPRVVNLDQTRLWPLHYMKDDHEDWADPLLWPVMADIFYKNKLRQMDISVCNSVINSITIFKLGDIKNGYIPDGEHMRKFAEFLRTPTQAMNMVWNDAIDIVDSFPPVEKILSMAKYESVDRDILRGIGIPDVLLGGSVDTNFSSGFLGVRTLLERLEEGRNAVIRWINRQLQSIATIMGHRKLPRVRFGKMSLRDEKAEKQLILGLLDRNVISIQSVLDTFGEDFEIEIERLRDEQKIRDTEDLLIQHGPYTDPMATLTDEEILDREEQQNIKMARMRRQMRGPQNQNGRPPNSEKPQEEKRETKPQGMAQLVQYEKAKAKVLHNIESIEKIVSTTILGSMGKKTRRSLTKSQMDGIEQITFTVASNLDSSTVNLQAIQEILQKRRSISRSILSNFEIIKQDDMTLKDRKLAMASAIAMNNMEVTNVN